MKPCFHFGMKFLLVGMVISSLLGTTMSNAQEITPTVDLNAYIPKGKEKLDTFTSQGFPFVIVRGWVKGKNFVDGSPIRVEFIHLYVEPKEGQNVSTSTSSIFFEGIYTIRDEKSYIVGRAVERDENATRIYQGSFFIHETGKNILSAHSENIEWDENINDLLVYATVYETDGSSITNSIAKKLPNGRWLVQIVNSDWEKEMKPHDTIYSIIYSLEEDGILNINFKNGDKYEVSMKDGQGKYYFANGDIYEGFISDDVVLGYEWYQDFSNTTVTFSNGERAKKNWMEILVDSCNCDVNFPGEEYSPLDRLINRSTSASDFRNNVREFINIVREISGAIKMTQNYTEKVDNIQIDMVLVEGGTFTMGATAEQGDDVDKDEKPAHSVTMSSYYISKYEITQAQWKAVMGTTVECQCYKEYGELSDHLYGVGDNYPMYYVSWAEAKEFCEKFSAMTGKKYDLPTEAQWEFAARGGVKSKGYKYSGSNNLNAVAWYKENSSNRTHAVGTKAPNELGIYDMSGNVWEWCVDGKREYSNDAVTDPWSDNKFDYFDYYYISQNRRDRYCRGGGWVNSQYSENHRVSKRLYGGQSYERSDGMGFRIVMIP